MRFSLQMVNFLVSKLTFFHDEALIYFGFCKNLTLYQYVKCPLQNL